MNRLLDQLLTDNEAILDLYVQQTQISLPPIINTQGYAYANSNALLPASQQSSAQTLNIAFQAHQPSPTMESAMESVAMTEFHQTPAAKTNMSPERAFALQSKNMTVIKDLYNLAVSASTSFRRTLL